MKFSIRKNKKCKENRFTNYILICIFFYFYVAVATDSVPICLASFIQWNQFLDPVRLWHVHHW